VWHAILAANQAMLDYLQREARYSRAGYHGAGSGRFADAHEWVIASFPQHTSRDGDPQLHVHNAVLNRVLRDDPLASEGQHLAWRTLDGAGLYAARPAAGAIAERTLAGQLADRLGVEVLPRPDGNGWEIAGIGRTCVTCFPRVGARSRRASRSWSTSTRRSTGGSRAPARCGQWRSS
jgi:TrwC relaxase